MRIDRSLNWLPEKTARQLAQELVTGDSPMATVAITLNAELLRRAEEIETLKRKVALLDEVGSFLVRCASRMRASRDALWYANNPDESVDPPAKPLPVEEAQTLELEAYTELHRAESRMLKAIERGRLNTGIR